MTFEDFCITLSRIEATTLRLEMTRLLAELFNTLSEDEIEPVCWLLLGRLAPLYENLEFNFAEKMMMRTLAEFVDHKALNDTRDNQTEQLGLLSTDVKVKAIAYVQAQFKETGDIGDVTEILFAKFQQKKKDVRSVAEVYAALRVIAEEGGGGSQDRKLRKTFNVLSLCTAQTAKYVVRIVLGTLRLGFSDMTMLDALSWAKKGDKSLRKALELAYQVKADIGKLARVVLTRGEKGLNAFEIELGIPIAPALCQRLKTADEMIEKMGKVFVEPKYDGTRVLIHFNRNGKDWQVRTFTRNLEESSGMFPELQSALSQLHVDEIILDSEAVGYDPETDKLLPFQLTIQRKRKHDVAETALKIPLRFFVFDVLYVDGKNIVHIPLHERKKILNNILLGADSTFVNSPTLVTENAEALRKYHAAQLGNGLEGVVIKQYASEYQPGRRGWSWVKFKEEEGSTGKLSDTLDCVVMGYYKGQGKRTSFGIGAFLVGVYDEKSDTFRTVAKIGTGLSDEQWREMKVRCERLSSSGAPKNYIVAEPLIPDVWTKAALVVEVAADEITNSPTHSAEKALRFPRLVRIRDDKGPGQATTLQELRAITMA
ncbi:MAG: ATP-dependent DNA ligase [Candidatus Pacebacteria bacterium]|nr:ATP-dependent DNA ligase [Candidatus Paceibacterota bacterium]